MKRPLAALPLLVGVLVGAPARAAARDVALRFACPDGARVRWTHDEELGAPPSVVRSKSTGAARVSRDGDGCQVEYERAAAAEDAGPDGEAPPAPPALVLDAAGAVLPGSGDGDLPREAEVWGDAVSRWSGKTATPGRTYEEVVAPDPERGSAAPLRLRWAVRRRLPCPGERRRACVELWARTTPDEDVLRLACATAGPSGTAELRHVVTELVVVTSPDDLLPRRARRETTSRPACPGGAPAATERWTRTWTWTR